jgi:hypothetical protein
MFRKHITLRRLLPIAVIAVAGATMASTADAMTISLGAPQLTSRVAITEPVTVTCSPFDQSLTLVSESINLQVEHASRFGFLPTLLFPCDGSQNTVPITISADPAGPPFHGGQAVFTASASAGAATPCFPGSTTCFTNPSANQTATTDPTALIMH